MSSPSTATVPDAPTGLSASAGPGKGVTLTWSAPLDVGGSAITGYKVYRSLGTFIEADLIASSTSTKYKDTTTTKNLTYYYAVKAVNAVGDSTFSNTDSATPTK